MQFKKPVSVLVVVHTTDLQILLLERARHAGFWQSVTGSQEGDEPLTRAAVRELAEETGIVVPPDRLQPWGIVNRFEILPLWRHRYADGVTHNDEHVFSMCVPGDALIVLADEEHSAWQWLPWRQAAEACFSWTNRDAIRMLALRSGTITP